MALALWADVLHQLWPNALPGMVDGVAKASAAVLARHKIATLPELIDFMAECSEETGGMTRVVESGAYTAGRAHEVWPSLFPTIASAAPFVVSQRVLFDKTYGGRLGNRPGTDDGYDFRGRGMIQITGRSWYEKIGAETGLDLVNHPELAASPDHILECAAAFWALDDVNKFADAGDFQGEVKRVNGGLTNMAARLEWRAACTKLLTLSATKAASTPAPATAAATTGATQVTEAATVNASPATASTPARVVPTSTQATRIPWIDWVEQILAHEEPVIVAAAQAGINLGGGSVPVIGPMIVSTLGPTIAKDAVDAAIKLTTGALDALKGKDDTITSSSIVLTTAAAMINSTAPTFFAKAEGLLDGWLQSAVAAIKV